MNGTGYTITGVLPPAFRFEDQPADIYTPIGRADLLFRNDRTVHDLLCLARLAPGVGIGQAQAQMNTLQERIDELNPTTEKGQGTSVVSLKQELVGNIGSTLVLLLGAVGLVCLLPVQTSPIYHLRARRHARVNLRFDERWAPAACKSSSN